MNYLGVTPYFVRVFIYNIIHSIVNYIGIYFISVLNTHPWYANALLGNAKPNISNDVFDNKKLKNSCTENFKGS